MAYPEIPNFKELADIISWYAELKHEYGAKRVRPLLKDIEKQMKQTIKELRKLPDDKALAKKRPDKYEDILKLRTDGPRKLWDKFKKKVYRDKLEGALLGRIAGCTLGAPVEFYTIEQMKNLAKETGMEFPPRDYWTYVPDPYTKRYETSIREEYTREKMKGVPVDDDITYTLLGLLIAEEYGPDFTIDQLGQAWMKYLPIACTAEDIALKNLKKGIPANKVGKKDNPFCEWIGAFIRSDPWGYMAPAWPEMAAKMAYKDAFLSHRREGVYGEMFFAAAISAAFELDDPVEALRVGLTEIPKGSELAKQIRWALDVAPDIKNYQDARDAIEQRFTQGEFTIAYKGMHPAHTINNACLVVWGITIGQTDFTKVISETVAMGMDNDCTAATAGSIVGAVVGKEGIPSHWYKNFNNTVYCYLNDNKKFKITNLVTRFTKQASLVYSSMDK